MRLREIGCSARGRTRGATEAVTFTGRGLYRFPEDDGRNLWPRGVLEAVRSRGCAEGRSPAVGRRQQLQSLAQPARVLRLVDPGAAAGRVRERHQLEPPA